MKTRCALYARVSSEDQAEKYGLPSQLRAMRDRAKSKGYEIVEEYVDDGYSGVVLDRPGLERLREAVRVRAIDLVLVYEPDRLSRQLSHLLPLHEEIEKTGVCIEYITIDYDADDEKCMFFQMKGVMAEFERKKIRERTLRGKREKARRGLFNGGRIAFGYKLGEDERWHIDKDRAEMVLKIFGWYADGSSIREITRRMNESGFKPLYSSVWNKSTIQQMLQYDGYTGRTYQNRYWVKEGKDENRRGKRNKKTIVRVRQRSEWVPFDVPQIVPKDLFNLASTRFERNKIALVGRPSRLYALRGLVFCAKCGRKMYGDGREGHRYYRCGGRDRVSTKVEEICRCTVRAEALEQSVLTCIADAFLSPDSLAALVKGHIDALRKSKTGHEKEIGILQVELDRLKKSEARAAKALLDPELDEQYDFFREQLSALGAKKKSLAARMAVLQREMGCAPGVDEIAALCARITKGASRASETSREALAKKAIDRVEYADGCAVITCVLSAADASKNLRQLSFTPIVKDQLALNRISFKTMVNVGK